MKRLILLISVILMSVTMAYSQTQANTWTYANKTVKIGRQIPAGDFIYLQDDFTTYQVVKRQSNALLTVANVFALGSSNIVRAMIPDVNVKIDSSSFTSNAKYVPSAYVQCLGVSPHHSGVQATDTISLANLPIGGTIMIAKLGFTATVIVKARSTISPSADTYFYPVADGNTKTGTTNVSVLYSAPKKFYRVSATEIWVY